MVSSPLYGATAHRSRFPNQLNRRATSLLSAPPRTLRVCVRFFLVLPALRSLPLKETCHPEARCLSAGPKDLNLSPGTMLAFRLPLFPPYRVPARPCILEPRHGSPSCLRPPLALRSRAWCARPPPPALALPPCSGLDLLLRLLLANLSNPRPPGPGRNSPRLRIFARRHQFHRLRPFLVRPHTSLVLRRKPHAHDPLLDRPPRFRPSHHQHFSSRDASTLLHLLLVLRHRRIRFFRLPIRRHAPRSRLYLSFPCSSRISSRSRAAKSANARQHLSASLGMVSHLLRIRHRQNRQRRPRVAPPHRHGRVLSKRSPPHLDRLVRAASTPLGPRRHRLRPPRPRACPTLDAF